MLVWTKKAPIHFGVVHISDRSRWRDVIAGVILMAQQSSSAPERDSGEGPDIDADPSGKKS